MHLRLVVGRVLEHLPRTLRLASATPGVRNLVNGLLIGQVTSFGGTRPRPLSLWGPSALQQDVADYVSWTGLVDRVWTGRHLPPADPDWLRDLPPLPEVAALFDADVQEMCPKSTALFGFFAQWFTDSFLRTDTVDVRRNTSNHEIDLCQIYGLTAADTALLKDRATGKLKSQWVRGQEFPAALCYDNGGIRDEFRRLSYLQKIGPDKGVDRIVVSDFRGPVAQKHLFATGLERGNQSIYYAAISTIFLREHNRLATKIAQSHPDWNGDRVFEIARNTNIAQLLKIIIEDYINHISSNTFRLFVDIGFAEKKSWYRTNRIAAEFNLLYRWHSLTPACPKLDGAPVPQQQFRFDNTRLLEEGVEGVLSAAVNMRSGRVGLRNTPWFLAAAEAAAIAKSRTWQLRSYNDYRDQFRLGRYRSFKELTRDDALAAELARIYVDIDQVELTVGLLAEWRGENALFGDLMGMMVATDAFSQALTNPLLAKAIYGEQAFSDVGLKSLESTTSFDQMVERNSRLEPGNARFGSPRLVERRSTIATPLIPPSFRIPFLSTAWDTARFFIGGDLYLAGLRRKYRSDLFRVNLFRPTIAVLDPAAISVLFDAKTIRQDYGFSWAVPPPELVGNVVPTIFESGPMHQQPKSFYMGLLRMRLATLGPVFDEVMGDFEKRWTAKRQFNLADELERFSATFAFKWLLRIEPDPADVATLYLNLFSHPFYKFFKPASYRRSKAIYDDLLQRVVATTELDDVRKLARGHGMADDVTARQLLFVTGMNSFLGFQNLSKSVLAEIGSRPKLREDLCHEIDVALGGRMPTDVQTLTTAAMPLLDRTLREVLRLHPPVSFIFGRPTEDRTIDAGGRRYEVRKGELLMGAISCAQRSDRAFTHGDVFNPYRMYGPGDSAALVWPRGFHDVEATSTDRTCPAKDIVVVIMKMLCVRLLPRYEWTFESPPKWNPRDVQLNRSAPAGRLAVRDFRPSSRPMAVVHECACGRGAAECMPGCDGVRSASHAVAEEGDRFEA